MTTKFINPVTGKACDPHNTDLEEGMFFEQIFSPAFVQVNEAEIDDKKVQYMELVNADGETIRLDNGHPQTHVMHFYWLDRGNKVSEYSSASPDEKSKMLNGQIEAIFQKKEAYKTLKFFYDPLLGYVSVASLKHKQISWSAVHDTVDAAILAVYGDVTRMAPQDRGNVWTYRLPVESKYVSVWAEVEAGNNKKQGRSAIRINTKVRTEFDRPSGGIAAPCLNWAHLWNVALNSLGLKAKTINKAKGFRLETEDGAAAVAPTMVNTFDIHLQSTEILQELIEGPLRQLKEFAESVVLKEYIELSITELIKAEEAVDMLDAYSDIHNLPAYIRNAILAKFKADEDLTVWGFSQAVSWVRTHGDLRGKQPRGQKSITFVLERIAGEVLSLAPTLQQWHRELGDITYEQLLGHPRATECPECEGMRKWTRDQDLFKAGKWAQVCQTPECEVPDQVWDDVKAQLTPAPEAV